MRRTASTTRTALVCSLGVAALAAAARIPGALRDAFWQDEVSSAHVLIQATPWGMLHQIARTEAMPPLWYGLGWLAHELGLAPAGYRAVSVLAGALLAAATMLLAARVLALWAAAVAGILAAFGWQLVMHGRELRAYELFALLAVCFAWVLLRETASPAPTGWRRYELAIVVACGALTSYFFLLGVVAALLWLWTADELRPSRTRISRQLAIGLVPLAVWSPVLIHQYLGQRFSWIGPFSVRGLIDAYWLLFAQHAPGGTVTKVLLPLLVLGGVIAGCALLARASTEGRLFALLALAPMALTALAWIAGAHVFDARNLIGAAPFAAIALAALPARLPRPAGYGVAVATAALMALAVVRAESTPPTPYDGVSRLLVDEGWRPADPIVLLGSGADFFAYRSPLEWYLPQQPTLTLGERDAGRSCPAIYVLAHSHRLRALVLATGIVAVTAEAGPVFVGRLSTNRLRSAGIWRHGHILAARTGPACVHLIPEAQLIAKLGR